MGKVISIINLKGGVGKTTLAVCLGEFLGITFRERTLLIDMDHQTNLTYAMVPPKTAKACAAGRKTIFHMFESALSGNQWSLRDSIVTDCSNIDGSSFLHLVVSLPDVGHLDEMILAAYENKNRFASDPRCILRNRIRDEGLMEAYDYILIDCPPSLGLPTINALLASDYFVVPVVPEFLSLQGLDLIMKRVTGLKDREPAANLDFAGTVLNKVSIQRTDHKEWSEVLFLTPEEKAKCTRELEDFIKRAQSGGDLAGLDIQKVKFGIILRDLRNNADFRPFNSWLGDLKPFYLVTDYGYSQRKHRKKYSSIEKKYDGSGTRPDSEKWPNLGRGEKHYDLFSRCKGLTEELMARCR